MLSLIDILRKEGKLLSELIAPFQKYYTTPELNFKVENKDLLIDKTAASFADGTISYLDGIKVDYSDWWFILRPSNTEDLIRLRIEATTPELLKEKKKLILTTLGF
jgi:phosphomannomutase